MQGVRPDTHRKLLDDDLARSAIVYAAVTSISDGAAAPNAIVMPRVNTGPKASRFVLLASVCVVVAALYFAQAVLIPLALAMLLSFLLAPLVARLEKWRIKRVPAVLIVVIALFALITV